MMHIKTAFLTASVLLSAVCTTPAFASDSVIDCPLRDEAYSVDTPLIDILLKPEAKAITDKYTGEALSKAPPMFLSTKAPSFAAIVSLADVLNLFGIPAEAAAGADAELRALTVTDADKTARCARYDNDIPDFDYSADKPRILIFNKVNGFYHTDAIPAADTLITKLGNDKGFAVYRTDKGGAINAETLSHFDVIVFNNNSGDVLTLSQRGALKEYLETGGGMVALHGAGGDTSHIWHWYITDVIGARFIGHPMEPQFQDARLAIENAAHPVASGLPAEWNATDEYYSFAADPALRGANIIVTLDESTYSPVGMGGQKLAMGDHHPIVWSRCVGAGRVLYSALGHTAEAYTQPNYITLLSEAIDWAADGESACIAGTGVPAN